MTRYRRPEPPGSKYITPEGARRLRAELVGREHTVILDVPYRRAPTPAVAAPSDLDSATLPSGQGTPSP